MKIKLFVFSSRFGSLQIQWSIEHLAEIMWLRGMLPISLNLPLISKSSFWIRFKVLSAWLYNQSNFANCCSYQHTRRNTISLNSINSTLFGANGWQFYPRTIIADLHSNSDNNRRWDSSRSSTRQAIFFCKKKGLIVDSDFEMENCFRQIFIRWLIISGTIICLLFSFFLFFSKFWLISLKIIIWRN